MSKTNGIGQAEVLTPEQLDLLIENLPEGTHKVVASTMRYCASRVSETLQLRFSDITESSILFRHTNTKTKQSRSLPLPLVSTNRKLDSSSLLNFLCLFLVPGGNNKIASSVP